MSNRAMLMLGLAVLAMALAVFVAERPVERDADTLGQPVMPTLDLSAVTSVRLRSADFETRLERTEDGFIVVERDYPASFTRVSALLNDLASATFRERKTALPENHEALGVRALDLPGSEAVEVNVSPGDARVLIGSEASGGDGVFVRLPEENQVWLVDRVREVAADPAVWLEPVIINVGSEQVMRVRLGDEDDALVAGRDDGTGDMTIRNVPEGRSLEYDTVGNSLARALVNVRLEDVRPRADEFAPDFSASYTLENGTTIEVLGDDGGANQHWIRFDMMAGDGSERIVDPADVDRLSRYDFRVRKQVRDAFAKAMEDVLAPSETEEESVSGD